MENNLETRSAKYRIPTNNVALAGEFAVLSRLALCGYDANMTLGRTKGVDILVSDPNTNRFYQLEVKTNLDSRKREPVSRLFGRFVSGWIMHEKHESMSRPELWYCFVTIGFESKHARFFVVPSEVVAAYVRAEHRLWLGEKPGRKDTEMRMFRIGVKGEAYRIPTPIDADYEDNWRFSEGQLNARPAIGLPSALTRFRQPLRASVLGDCVAENRGADFVQHLVPAPSARTRCWRVFLGHNTYFS